jgi:hypothetical protein
LGEDRKEAMFILSQLIFGDFLNEPAYAATVKQLQLPLPKGLDRKYSHGEADFIIIHCLLRILIGELKAIGRWHWVHHSTEAPDKEVVKRVQKAVKQLEKSKKVISYVIDDIAPSMTVQTTIFLPYVSSTQLHRVLTANRALGRVSFTDTLSISRHA